MCPWFFVPSKQRDTQGGEGGHGDGVLSLGFFTFQFFIPLPQGLRYPLQVVNYKASI